MAVSPLDLLMSITESEKLPFETSSTEPVSICRKAFAPVIFKPSLTVCGARNSFSSARSAKPEVSTVLFCSFTTSASRSLIEICCAASVALMSLMSDSFAVTRLSRSSTASSRSSSDTGSSSASRRLLLSAMPSVLVATCFAISSTSSSNSLMSVGGGSLLT